MQEKNYGRIVGWSLAGLVLAVIVLFGFIAIAKSFGRYQKRADAENQVKVTSIQIKNQQQRVQIAKQQAEIRHQEALGIRAAQDAIAKTLTPLYVAHELTQAMKEVATSGVNNTIIYLPTDPATGLPVVPTSNLTKGGK